MQDLLSPTGSPGRKGSRPSLITCYSSALIPLPGAADKIQMVVPLLTRMGPNWKTPPPGFPNASQTSVLEAPGALLLGWWGAERQPSLATGLDGDCCGRQGLAPTQGTPTGPGMPSFL